MKVHVSCMTCLKDLGLASFESIFVNFDNNLVAKGKCSRDHNFDVILEANKFEIFLDCGAEALLNEYPLEASFNFAVARENLFLFALEIMLYDSSPEEYINSIKNQSERIFGAFSAMYYHNFNKIFKLDKKQEGINKNIVAFGNDIIHKGFIPTIEEATAYGTAIYDETVTLISALRDRYEDQILKHLFSRLNKLHELHNYENYVQTSGAIMFSLARDQKQETHTFTKQLSNFKDHISRMNVFKQNTGK